MSIQDFHRLSSEQKTVMMAAVQIRNCMEDFHVKHPTDEQMAELNPIIRQGLFD